MSKWKGAVDKLFDSGEQVSFASLAQASLGDDVWLTKTRQKFGTDKLEYERNTPNNQPINLVQESKPISVERVRELRNKVAGFSYSGRTSTGRKFEVSAEPSREDSKLHKAYATYQGRKVALDWSFVP